MNDRRSTMLPPPGDVEPMGEPIAFEADANDVPIDMTPTWRPAPLQPETM